MVRFRCALASLERTEPLIGTASTVRAYLLVEYAGAWGRDALRDARLPEPMRAHLLAAHRRGVKVLLMRRHGRSSSRRSTVFAAYAQGDTSWIEATELERLDDLVGVDLEPLAHGRSLGLEPHPTPVVAVCTHGRHDACCAELGRPLAAALNRSHPDLVWEVSHVGGDRFAGNLLVLPDGLYYGRVDPDDAAALVDGHLAGLLDLGHLRGRSSLGFAAQAAEWHLRRTLDESRIDAVRTTGVRRDRDRWEVDFLASGTPWRVSVRQRSAAPQRLTCGAARPSAAPEFSPELIRRLDPDPVHTD